MYCLEKTTITPNYYATHWSLKKGPSNKPKKPTELNYKGETMPNHTLNTRPNTLLNLNSVLQTKGNTRENPWYDAPKIPPQWHHPNPPLAKQRKLHTYTFYMFLKYIKSRTL